jgi:hypothetical protein
MAANVHLTLVAPDNEKCTVQSGGHALRNRRPALRRRPSYKVEKWSWSQVSTQELSVRLSCSASFSGLAFRLRPDPQVH